MRKSVAFLLVLVLAAFGIVALGKSRGNEPEAEPAVTKYSDGLFLIRCDKVDYAAGERFYADHPVSVSRGSVMRIGSYVGFNYDAPGEENCTLVIAVPAAEGRYESVSVATVPAELGSALAKSGAEAIPDYLVCTVTDGVNSEGLFCGLSALAISGSSVPTSGTNPDGEILCLLSAVRCVLDRAASVDEALTVLAACNLYAPTDESGLPVEYHLMLADAKKTVILEYVDNVGFTTEEEFCMTNSYKTKETDFTVGSERERVMKRNEDYIETAWNMMKVMQKIRFSCAYDPAEDPVWFSEYYGVYGEGALLLDAKTEKALLTRSVMPLLDPDWTEPKSIFEGESKTESGEESGESGEESEAEPAVVPDPAILAERIFTQHSAVYDLTNRTVNVVGGEGKIEIAYRLTPPAEESTEESAPSEGSEAGTGENTGDGQESK